jgi:hypothetical protein
MEEAIGDWEPAGDRPPAGQRDDAGAGSGVSPPLAVGSLPRPVAPPPFGETSSTVRQLTGRDWVAIIFASVVFGIIFCTLVVIVRHGYAPLPDLSKIPVTEQKDAIEHFKDLNSVLKERTENMFDLMIVKAFLPLLATLIGFILGTRSRGAE